MSTTTQVIEKQKIGIPRLRFPEFNGDWRQFELKDLTTKITVGIATEVRPYISTKTDIPLLRNQNIKAGYFDNTSMEYITHKFDESNKNKRVQSGDVIIVRTGSNMGNSCVVPKEYENSQTFTTLIVRPLKFELESRFLSYHINYLGLSEIERLSAGGGKPNLNAGFLKHYRINVSDINEQIKIANFLTSVDEKLQALKEKKNLLEQYKKGVIQQIFSQELRFKDDNGNNFTDWKEKTLGELLIKNSKKNKNQEFKLVQSVSNKHGFVNQDEYFEDRIIASKDLSNYYVIQKGDFAYNPSRIDVGSLAYKFDNITSVISPLYISFKTDKNYLNDDFLLEWFFTQNFTRQMNSSFEGSVRNTLSYESLTKIEIEFPSLEEQTKIANFLSAIDDKISHCQSQIEKTEIWKKGLLQQMFV